MNLASLVRSIAQERTVRLVASARLRPPVLSLLVPNEDLAALSEIEGATSGRLRAQDGGAEKLDARELVYGIAHGHFINASFSYWLPKALNRFNGPGRGAWYAALEIETALAEVIFHIERELAFVGDFRTVIDYCEMFASFIGEFVDLRIGCPQPELLDADVGVGYPTGNTFADSVRTSGYYGIIYPSVRRRNGTCLVALVPHAVQAVAQGRVLRLCWNGVAGPTITPIPP